VSRQTIAIGADHAGYQLKNQVAEDLKSMGFDVLDMGTNSDASVDYPDFGYAVAQAVLRGQAFRGVLICGTGVGMSIAANRHAGIRAALCTHGVMARLAREHNDANVLVMGARIIGTEIARECVRQFLSVQYAGGRHDARVAKLGQPSFEEAAE
jgi:ribose 5-phosphate isomerase B